MKRIVILISGRGSNLQALVQACSAERWPAQVVAVISNRPAAAGLALADDLGLATEVVDHTLFADRSGFDDALAATIDRHAPDLVLLAGFMRILGDGFVARYAGRMLNIHPRCCRPSPGCTPTAARWMPAAPWPAQRCTW